jgi:hypothetical protein
LRVERYLVQIALFLAAGAIATVVVAWACAAWSRHHPTATVPAAYGGTVDSVIAPPSADDLERMRANGYTAVEPGVLQPMLDDLPVGVIEFVGLGIDHRCFRWLAPGIGPMRTLGCDVRAGWPARCLSGLRWRNPPDFGRVQGGFWGAPVREGSGRDVRVYVDAFAVPGRVGPVRFSPDRTLPLRPLWRGLALNVAAWAGLLWLVTLGPFELRRLVRQAAGRCLRCGYDLRGEYEEGCPECGWARQRRGLQVKKGTRPRSS